MIRHRTENTEFTEIRSRKGDPKAAPFRRYDLGDYLFGLLIGLSPQERRDIEEVFFLVTALLNAVLGLEPA